MKVYSDMYDVAIIGGGVMGVSVARELSKYKLNVVVLERSYDLGEGATKANSGVLGAGFHPRGGSLKGISCVRGNEMYREIAQQLGIDIQFVGSLFVAFHDDGMKMIEDKYKKGLKNGVQGMSIINGDQARVMQPGLSDQVIQALYAPTIGIINVFQLIVKTAQSAAINGVEFLFDTEVIHLEPQMEWYRIHTNSGEIRARYVVNTAGEEAAKVESWVRPADLIIKPRRGQFYVFDKSDHGLCHVIYQAQESDEKGCLLAPSVEGNIIAGPTSENVPSYKNVETTRKGLNHIEKVARKILPNIDIGRVITSFAGVRANIKNVAKEDKDFVIRHSSERFVSALGIKNPGLTAAPYLALLAVNILVDGGLTLEPKQEYQPSLPQMLPVTGGNIVCRCEHVTEEDIIRALQQPLPPKSINGLKKRLRTGMGRCQGSFCTPRIIEILSRYWNVPPEKVMKSIHGSQLVKGKVK